MLGSLGWQYFITLSVAKITERRRRFIFVDPSELQLWLQMDVSFRCWQKVKRAIAIVYLELSEMLKSIELEGRLGSLLVQRSVVIVSVRSRDVMLLE